MPRAVRLSFAVIAAALLGSAPLLILAAPLESSMGFVQKIFYFHVPLAFMTFLAVFVAAFGAAWWLWKRDPRADRLLVAGTELAVLFGACVLVTGPLWARKAWGVYWQWDVRLTTTLLLWLVCLASLFVRRYGGPAARSLTAGLAIFGAADVPLIYLSVSIWRTIHPKTTVVKTLGPDMMLPFAWSAFGFLALFIVLLELRMSLEKARAQLDELALAVEDHLER